MKTSSNTINPKSKLNIVCALSAEARVLIDHYRLHKCAGHAFTVFANQQQNIHLIVSGIGQVAMAAACGYLQQLTGAKSNTVWLNIGIAGSSKHSLGSLRLINKITNRASHQSWYPSVATLISPLPLRERGIFDLNQAALITTMHPENDYIDQALYDMEGSAFFEVVKKFVTQEQITLLKIVSDQSIQDQTKITKQSVKVLFEKNLVAIDQVVQRLLALSTSEAELLPNEAVFEHLTQKYHFSQYQQHELRDVLRRWQAVRGNEDPLNICDKMSSGKTAIAALKNAILEGISTKEQLLGV